MKEMKTLKFPNQEEAYEIVDAYAREQVAEHTHDFSELTVNDPEAAKTALAIENGMVFKNLQATIPISDNWYSIAYGNGKFVSVSYNYKVVYSEDGVNWYTSKLADSASYGEYYVIYANGKFIATCSYRGSSIYYSDDGITWTKQTLTGANGLRIAYGNNIFVALNCGGGGQSNTAYYSDDAINWTAVTISTDRWNNIVYGNGRFIILSYNSLSAYYSDDGINWNPTSLSSRCYNTTAAYGNGKFVVTLGSASEKIMYSEDGINWSNATLPVSGTYIVTYGNNKFVMVDTNSNTVLYSEDGINWNSTLSPSPGSRSVVYGNDRFIAMPYQGTNITFSYDGITWYDSIQYISQNDTDVTADTLAVLKHTHNEYLTEQVQADLSQTDSAQPDYVKGVIRQESLPEGYPYKEIVPETIIDNETISFVNQDGLPMDVSHSFELVPGQTCKVIWDGTEYNCNCLDFGGGAGVIGNLSVLGGVDTGEPFLFMSNAAMTAIVSTSGEGDHIVSLITNVAVYHIVDPNYLPIVTKENAGVIKFYRFEWVVSAAKAKEAVDAFNAGQAILNWNGANLIHAHIDTSDNSFHVIKSSEPGTMYRYECEYSTGIGDCYNETLRIPENIGIVRANNLYIGDYTITDFVNEELSTKQNVITGTAGQLVVIGDDGNAVAQDLSTIATVLGAAQIQTGSYTGTGTNGSSNKSSLTFSFDPKYVLIVECSSSGNTYEMHLFKGQTKTYVTGSQTSYCDVTWGTKKVTWYTHSSTADEMYQMNMEGYTYHWVAIG